MNEQWKPIPGFGSYIVSDAGRIARLMAPSLNHNGYRVTTLTRDDGKRTNILLHRVVLEAFDKPCPEGMETRHLDGDRQNNAIENLVWGEWADNHMDAIAHGKRWMDKLTDKQKEEIWTSTEPIKSLARKYGVCPKTIKYHKAKA